MEAKKNVFLFSGQGSQYRNMGRSLYENNSVFKRCIDESNQIINQYLKIDLVEELYISKNKNFEDILITHPAIVAIESAMNSVLQSMNIMPNYVLGNSLGSFAAAVACGFWTKKQALIASIKQAQSIVKSNVKGGMLAVLSNKTQSLVQDYNSYNLVLASDNFKGHFTLSGLSEDINAFQDFLKRKQINFFRLPVTVPFHSPLITNSFDYFDEYVAANSNSSKLLKSNFISSVTNSEVTHITANYFKEVVSVYSSFSKSISYLEQKGGCFYIDLGPSGTSATFVKYNLEPTSTSSIFQIMTPFGNELKQLEKIKEQFAVSV